MKPFDADEISALENGSALCIVDDSGHRKMFPLSEGQSVIAGSGENCGIRLKGDDVNVMHCMFQFEDNRLYFQDWNTGGKTLLNGNAVTDRDELTGDDELVIGNYRFQAFIKDAGKRQPAPTGTADASEDSTCSPEPHLLDETAEHAAVAGEPVVDRPEWGQPVREDLDATVEAGSVDANETPDTPFPPAEVPLPNLPKLSPADLTAMIPSTDDMQLLHEEIEYLQTELARRDEQIQQLSAGEATASSPDNSSLESESERLVQRMEQLIAELNSSDQRILMLEEQLQMSDEANRAESQERKHLESWVLEIEKMIGHKVAETKAELDRLQQQARTLRTERDLALQQLQYQPGPTAAGQSNTGDNPQLRERITKLEECLASKNEQLELLTRKNSEEFDKEQYETQIHELTLSLRQMELDASREKALIARQKAEIAKFRNELDRQAKQAAPLSDADCRIQAMRQHLQELHEEEQKSRAERRDTSLAGRISRLWQRLDDR